MSLFFSETIVFVKTYCLFSMNKSPLDTPYSDNRHSPGVLLNGRPRSLGPGWHVDGQLCHAGNNPKSHPAPPIWPPPEVRPLPGQRGQWRHFRYGASIIGLFNDTEGSGEGYLGCTVRGWRGGRRGELNSNYLILYYFQILHAPL